ncbi:BsSco [Mycobacteroides abscessus subsp. abscessus]|nr:BsSco [Mycobacteroides abscessus subsp. abscessus]
MGRFLLVYFGFTHCQVVCPRSLKKLSAILQRLGAEAMQITPLYITVDPERDTPERMRTYLETNGYPFIGLTGKSDRIDAAKAAFRVFAERKSEGADHPDGYSVPHTAIAYLMSPTGQYVDHYTDSIEESEIYLRIQHALS